MTRHPGRTRVVSHRRFRVTALALYAPSSEPRSRFAGSGIDASAGVAVDAGAGTLTLTRTADQVKQSVGVTSSSDGIGTFLHTTIGNDLVAALVEVADPESLIALRVSLDGVIAGERLTIPNGNMVQNGIQFLVHGGNIYVETGSLEGVTVVRYSVPATSAT